MYKSTIKHGLQKQSSIFSKDKRATVARKHLVTGLSNHTVTF